MSLPGYGNKTLETKGYEGKPSYSFVFFRKRVIEKGTWGNFFNELGNHLGNVLLTCSDRKIAHESYTGSGIIDYYSADIKSATDYYPGGFPLPGRSFNLGSYRFGHNGQESDAEITGSWGNNYTAEFWEYDSRTIRRWNEDPITCPWLSPYSAFSDNPIAFDDPDGLQPKNKNHRNKIHKRRKVPRHTDKFNINVGENKGCKHEGTDISGSTPFSHNPWNDVMNKITSWTNGDPNIKISAFYTKINTLPFGEDWIIKTALVPIISDFVGGPFIGLIYTIGPFYNIFEHLGDRMNYIFSSSTLYETAESPEIRTIYKIMNAGDVLNVIITPAKVKADCYKYRIKASIEASESWPLENKSYYFKGRSVNITRPDLDQVSSGAARRRLKRSGAYIWDKFEKENK
ncbi:MAG: hypothetical protein HGB12_08405 [Bacteroidetes bacterium]|nr:hypothetical protein [Bacteroidota bacterium]